MKRFIYNFFVIGRLAQLVAHHIDIVEVAGSSPVLPKFISKRQTKFSFLCQEMNSYVADNYGIMTNNKDLFIVITSK